MAVDGEGPLNAAKRELYEESGLRLVEEPRLLEEYLMYGNWTDVFLKRHVFLFEISQKPFEEWTHVVAGNGADQGLNFHYSWMRLSEAESKLNASFGSSIKCLGVRK